MEHNDYMPTKKQLKASSDEWAQRKAFIKKRELNQRRVKAEKDGGKIK